MTWIRPMIEAIKDPADIKAYHGIVTEKINDVSTQCTSFKLVRLATVKSIEHNHLLGRIISFIQEAAPWIEINDRLLYCITYRGGVAVINIPQDIQIKHLQQFVKSKEIVMDKPYQIWARNELEVKYPSLINAIIPNTSDIIGITNHLTNDDINRLFNPCVKNNYEEILEFEQARYDASLVRESKNPFLNDEEVKE